MKDSDFNTACDNRALNQEGHDERTSQEFASNHDGQNKNLGQTLPGTATGVQSKAAA